MKIVFNYEISSLKLGEIFVISPPTTNVLDCPSAAYVLLTTLVLADLLGADKFTNAFGLLLLFQGVATFIGPPVVGAIFDQSGSYNGGFILMGGMISLSGLMLYPIPCIKNRLRQRQEANSLLLS